MLFRLNQISTKHHQLLLKMPIMTIDCYDDMIENNLSMVQLIKEEKIRKANEVVVYGKSLPTEVWGLIKEFAGYTDKVRNRRVKDATRDLEDEFIPRYFEADEKEKKEAFAYGRWKNYKSSRKDRIAPPVKIGDEVFCRGKVCGLVSKVNKASIDIKVYGWIYYKKEIGKAYERDGRLYNSYRRYKWKKDIIRDTPIRWIGSYSVGEFNQGFKE